MKLDSLATIVLLGAGLIAQSQQPQEVKVPRAPSTGTMEKLTPAFEPKLDMPVSQPTPRDADLPRPLDARAKAVADAAAASHALHASTDANALLIDRPAADGAIWVRGNNYKASFDRSGWNFINRSAAGATQLQPIRFHLDRAAVGGEPLATADAAPVQNQQRIEYRHGDVLEAIDLDATGVEQTFTFKTLPARGELVVDLGVTTTLQGANLADGIAFTSPWDSVHYASAVAIEARGRRVAATTILADGRITIRVPASFVAGAELPLVIDPRVNSSAAIVHTDPTHDLGNPDVAWDDSSATWAVCYQLFFAAGDWDCYVQRLDANLAAVGGAQTVDFTTMAWQRPRIANLNQYDQFMVVAEVRSGTNPVKVSGRILDNAGGYVTGQFDIATSAVDEINPDIGGDPTVAPPTYFTVVWEHSYSATDHDIYARQVDSTGTLRGTGITYVQTDTNNQTHPSISKSDGAAPYGTQRFVIVYEQPFSAIDQDIWGAMLTWDGNFVPVAAANQFHVDFSGSNDVWPQVSSPTLTASDGNRYWLAAYQDTGSNGGDIVATCMDVSGTYTSRLNLSVAENQATRLPWNQQMPSVDCDGRRFTVGYHENYNNGTTDLDTRCDLVALANGALAVQEAGVILAYSGSPEFNIAVASTYSGNAVFSGTRYCTVNDRDVSGVSFNIDAYAYDGYAPGGLSSRATACGGLTISPTSGSAVIGSTLTFTVGSGPFLTGALVGFPVAAPIPGCSGCTLGATTGNPVIGSPVNLGIPPNPSFVGLTLSVQGFQFAFTGPCLGSLSLSDTVDFTIQ